MSHACLHSTDLSEAIVDKYVVMTRFAQCVSMHMNYCFSISARLTKSLVGCACVWSAFDVSLLEQSMICKTKKAMAGESHSFDMVLYISYLIDLYCFAPGDIKPRHFRVRIIVNTGRGDISFLQDTSMV